MWDLVTRLGPLTSWHLDAFSDATRRLSLAFLHRQAPSVELQMLEVDMTDLETQRLENIKQNRALLAELNVEALRNSTRIASSPHARPPTKRRKLDNPPSRTSVRIASSTTKPSYRDHSEKFVIIERARSKKKRTSRGLKQEIEDLSDNAQLIPARDVASIQQGWIDWKPTAPAPTRDDQGTFHFADEPTFTPNKSPEEIIREGCFGGSYWRPLRSRKLGIVATDDYKELPPPWIAGLDTDRYLTSPTYDADVNKFKVSCGQSIEEWEAAGWIDHSHDVRGWFQWYCRFYQGRRCADDARQISRWRKCVGETGRWRKMLLKKYMALGVRDVFDDGADEDAPEVSPVMHQTCHHWAFEVRQGVLDEFWRSGR